MRTIIIIFCIIMHINLDAMKRKSNEEDNKITKKMFLEDAILSKYLYLPNDMWFLILCTIPYNKKEVISKKKIITYRKDKLKTTIKTIKALALTHKILYSYYNNQKNFNCLLNIIHKAHNCSHESIMNRLCPPAIWDQAIVQKDLKELLLTEKASKKFKPKFNVLLTSGARLDFTYNHNYQPHTPLMMITSSERGSDLFFPETNIITLFLTHGNTINETTSHGTTTLMSIAKYPIGLERLKIIIKQDGIDINQKNNRGETALIRCIRNREKHQISGVFIKTIQKLLKYGANPCLKDKNGNTALSRAQKLSGDILAKAQVIELITDAIAKKTPSS